MMKVFGNLLFKIYNLIFSFSIVSKLKINLTNITTVFKFLKLKKTLNFQIKAKK